VNSHGSTDSTHQRGRISDRGNPLSTLSDRSQARFSGPVDTESARADESVIVTQNVLFHRAFLIENITF
jgi:hypothetical protein